MKSTGNEERINEEKIYCKPLKILIKNGENEERCSPLIVSAELHSTLSSLFRKDLVVRLTDDQNPLFFYHLKLNDDDYQSLRIQQGLLVDFASFPQKFIDLLEQCRLEETKSSPRFILQLSLPNATSMAILNVVEINPFKHLVHLAVKLAPGSDSEVKGYLSTCLTAYKTRNEELHNHLNSSELDMNGRLRMCKEQLANSATEIDQLRQELRDQAHALSERYNRQLCSEKDKASCVQNEMQVKYERECMELTYNHNKVVGRLEAEVLSLKAQVEKLSEKRLLLESTVHELRNRVSVAEDESQSAHQEMQKLHKENNRLETSKGDWERASAHLNDKIVIIEQELKSKEMQLLKLQAQFETTQEQKIRFSEDLALKQSLLNRRENAIKSLSDDLNKGNEIIRKLQMDIRTIQGKLKLRNKVTQEQEKVVSEKEKAVDILQDRVRSLEERLQQKENEVKILNESLSTTNSKLDESQKILKTNENVINWLNKQLNEVQVNQHRENTVATTAPAQNTPFRPLGNAEQRFTTSTPGSAGNLSNPSLASRPTALQGSGQGIIQGGMKVPTYGLIVEEPMGQRNTPPTTNKENNPPRCSANVISNAPTRYKSTSNVRLPRTSIAFHTTKGLEQSPSAYFHP